MAKGPTYTVRYRRRRTGKTDYKKRLALLKSENLRLVIRPTSNHIIAQLVAYDDAGDRIKAAANSSELTNFSWKYNPANLPSAYLTGLLCALRAKEKDKKQEVIVDTGLAATVTGSRIFAVAKGALDGGLNILHDAKVLPPKDRINGKITAEYEKSAKDMNKDFDKTVNAIKKAQTKSSKK